MKKNINLISEKNSNKIRVDIFIKKKETSLSRTRIKNLILNKKLKVNNKVICNPSYKIISKDKISLETPEPIKASLKPYNYKLDIIYNLIIFLTKFLVLKLKRIFTIFLKKLIALDRESIHLIA